MTRWPFLSGGGAACCMRCATGEWCTDLVSGGADLALAHDSYLARLPVPDGEEKHSSAKTRPRSAYRSPPLTGRAVPACQDLTGGCWGSPLADGDECHMWILLSVRTLLAASLSRAAPHALP